MKQGEVLMCITGIERSPGREPSIEARVASFEREIEILDQTLVDDLAAADDRERLNADRLALTRERLRAARYELETRHEQQALHDLRSMRLAQLVTRRAIPAQLAEEAVATALQAKAASHSARQQLLDLEDQILIIERQIHDGRSDADALRHRALMRREELGRQLAASHLQASLEIRAPAEGVASGLTVKAGDFVRAGDVLATLHDPGSRIEARLYLDPSEAGRISNGLRVEIQVRAYPHEIFGTVTAIVESVSPAAVPADEVRAGITSRTPVFEVRAVLLKTNIEARNRAWKLPPGTTVRADIIRHRWPLYRWLWRSAAGAGSLA